jgi:hypothetical protein
VIWFEKKTPVWHVLESDPTGRPRERLRSECGAESGQCERLHGFPKEKEDEFSSDRKPLSSKSRGKDSNARQDVKYEELPEITMTNPTGDTDGACTADWRMETPKRQHPPIRSL